MTVCKVLLYGLKPCDISSNTNDKISDIPSQRLSTALTKEKSSTEDADFLNVDIKPSTTPTSSVSMTKERD
jgi:hypothetical protein